MVIYCAALNCYNKQEKGSGISFYHFPREPEIRKKWIIATKRKDFVPSKYSRLCSKHFETNAFQIRPNCFFELLKKEAIPTIFEFPYHLKTPPEKKKRVIVKTQVDLFNVQTNEATSGVHELQIDNSLHSQPSSPESRNNQQEQQHPNKTTMEGTKSLSCPLIQCPSCSKKFSTKSNWNRHIHAVHQARKNYLCTICERKFAVKHSLNMHIKNVHSVGNNNKSYICESCPYQTNYQSCFKRHCNMHKKGIQKIQCATCSKKFYSEHRLKRHKQNFHPVGNEFRYKLKCPLCPYESVSRKVFNLYKHFENIHFIKIQKTLYKFDTLNEFYIWKSDLEKSTETTFIKNTTTNNKIYYHCHRRGYHKSRNHNKGNIKSRRSCKINGYCPAKITLKIIKEKVYVIFVATHVGHDNELKIEEDDSYLTLGPVSIKYDRNTKRPVTNVQRIIAADDELGNKHLTDGKDLGRIKKEMNYNDNVAVRLFQNLPNSDFLTNTCEHNEGNTNGVALEEILEQSMVVHEPIIPTESLEEKRLQLINDFKTLVNNNYNDIEIISYIENEVTRMISNIDRLHEHSSIIS